MNIFTCPSPWLPVLLTVLWAGSLGLLVGAVGMRWALRNVDVRRVGEHSQVKGAGE